MYIYIYIIFIYIYDIHTYIFLYVYTSIILILLNMQSFGWEVKHFLSNDFGVSGCPVTWSNCLQHVVLGFCSICIYWLQPVMNCKRNRGIVYALLWPPQSSAVVWVNPPSPPPTLHMVPHTQTHIEKQTKCVGVVYKFHTPVCLLIHHFPHDVTANPSRMCCHFPWLVYW